MLPSIRAHARHAASTHAALRLTRSAMRVRYDKSCYVLRYCLRYVACRCAAAMR